MLRRNSKSLGNPCSQSWRRKGKAAVWEGLAEKEGFKPGMNSGVTMEWLLRLVTGAPLVVGGPRQF